MLEENQEDKIKFGVVIFYVTIRIKIRTILIDDDILKIHQDREIVKILMVVR